MTFGRCSWSSAAPALVLVLALASCGGSSAKSTPTGSTAGGGSTAPATNSRSAPSAAARAGNWRTYHANLARTGVDPTAPRVGRVRRAWSREVDGQVYAEPLVSAGRVIVATENNTLYALRAATGRVVWRTHLGTPVDGGSLPCGNIDPSGITGTPAIDGAGSTVYAVAFLSPAHHVLFAVDVATGRVKWQRAIDAPGADPKTHQQRPALALSRGRVYVSYGGLFGDCGQYHGQVVSVPAGGPRGALRAFQVPTEREGAIWAPSGPAIDSAGNVFVSTGNGSSTSRFDFGNAVIRLTPGLRRTGFFAPRNWAQLNGADTDLASVGPLLLPRSRVFAIGKEGVGYLLNANRLGGIGGQLRSRSVCDSAFGGAAYAGGLVYVPCTDGLVALRAGSLAQAWEGPGFRAGPPIVAGGAVWTVDLDGGTLFALNARTGATIAQESIGDPAQFSTPTSAGGRIFVGGGSRVIALSGA